MKAINQAVFSAVLTFAGFSAAVGASAQTPSAPSGPAVDTSYMTYDEGPISLPLGVGLRIPRYDRVDGVALPWGPKITLGNGRFELDPTVTYRSHLGKFDPYGIGNLRLAPSVGLTVEGGRATFSNDEWIRSTIVNSLASIGVGSDARNYFRADRGTASITYEVIGNGTTLTPRLGFLHENAWSTGSAEPHTSAPWSFFGRTSVLKMRRPNPSIAKGHTTSGMAGVGYSYDLNEMVVKLDANVEHAFDAPQYVRGTGTTGNFTQVTLDGQARFPTIGTQSFSFRGHGLLTPGDGAPPQRYGYLGGAGTLATVDLLAMGGDRLAYVQGEYNIPLVKPILPFVGPPIIGVRYAAGAAGAGSLPAFIQNIGASIGVKFIKLEYHIDPNYHKTAYSHKNAFSVGLSLSM
jgi:hypothetical protein